LNIYDPKRTFPYITDFSQNPVEAAAYVKDKLELESFVLDFGLRVDYMNQRAPYRLDPLDTASVVNSTAKTQVSPRFGIAHPVTDRTSLYFSYGHFFQIPTYDRFYENSQYDFNVREPLIGNPDLNAMKTVAYEVGITHQFSTTFAGSFTAMYKDVTGLIGTQYFPPYVGGRYVGYTLYVNDSYANVRGFEVSLTMRRTGNVAGSLSYTYQVARGNASSEIEDYPAVTPSTQLAPLDWDRTHVLNANVNLVFLDNDGPDIFGAKVLANSSWSLLLRAGTGYPYTPSGRDIGLVAKNSARMPGDYTLDFLVTKEWIIRPLTVGIFLEVLNLTDAKNVRYVYPDTGLPEITYEGVHSQEWMADPSNYGPPRRIHLGARLRF
jgi:outer membrane receptor protein involved in Fe transport